MAESCVLEAGRAGANTREIWGWFWDRAARLSQGELPVISAAWIIFAAHCRFVVNVPNNLPVEVGRSSVVKFQMVCAKNGHDFTSLLNVFIPLSPLEWCRRHSVLRLYIAVYRVQQWKSPHYKNCNIFETVQARVVKKNFLGYWGRNLTQMAEVL